MEERENEDERERKRKKEEEVIENVKGIGRDRKS